MHHGSSKCDSSTFLALIIERHRRDYEIESETCQKNQTKKYLLSPGRIKITHITDLFHLQYRKTYKSVTKHTKNYYRAYNFISSEN